MSKIISLFMSIIMLLFPWANIPNTSLDTENAKTQYSYVFVHGLSGWGEYDAAYQAMPYWGMRGGDLMKYLRARGVDAHAASVNPTASAWDRACELYAQLTGTRVDYGKEHAERCGHRRYGTNYTGRALIGKWDAENKINILGHSFGGATVLQLVELMANGSEAEQAATPASELSGLFSGGKADWFWSVTMLSAPMNGTTAYEVGDRSAGEFSAVGASTAFFNLASVSPLDGRKDFDTARYDMHIDNAIPLAQSFETLSGVYYFSIPCCKTTVQEDGTSYPGDPMELMFRTSSEAIGKASGVTAGGFVYDESWQPNDGLVNTISARAPFGAPQKDIDRDDIDPGIWNVFPTYDGDHMALQGGFTHMNPIRELYMDLINMINGLG
ncbi:MAG: hypothetical protein IJJ85_00055 [Clostridia bacterium]|nr:hypothetical protein [Clostridia bacterium]